MAPPNLPPIPSALKSIQHYLKVAIDYDTRDPPISYWCRLHALQQGLTHKKSKEDMGFLITLMDWLEKTKQELKSQETISDEIVAQAHIENVALKLFNYADNEDRAQHYTKNVVKAFYTAGMLLDVCAVFGELSEEVAQQKKYAKWRAAHLHSCLNTGETPSEPAPKQEDEEVNDSDRMEYGISSSKNPANTSESFHETTWAEPTISVPSAPAAAPPSTAQASYVEPPSSDRQVSPEEIIQAQKFIKFAASSLTYEDVPSAIDNLLKALRLLQAGHNCQEMCRNVKIRLL
uniref:EOG090X0GPB n=1 Tax=Moina brachiata TaxID=675436 RepID=A0A4Y7NJC9_9CRUS|nr:EOG090X0GPB [Moina brachiata]